jgi:hypothetical protein
VNSVLNLRVPRNAGKLSSVLRIGISRVVLSSAELVSYQVEEGGMVGHIARMGGQQERVWESQREGA